MSTYWLKPIGTVEEHGVEHYARPYVDFAKNRRPKRIRRGDYLVLYAVGGSKRVFALAQVTSEVYENKEFARWPYRVDISYQVNLPASAGVHIDEVSTPERDLLRSLMRASYIELRPEEYERAAAKLQEAAGKQ